MGGAVIHRLSWPLWQRTFRGLDDVDLWVEAETSYLEPHRYYHTAQHINECLELYHSLPRLPGKSLAVEAALWLHDVVCDRDFATCETRSAALARKHLTAIGWTTGKCDEVCSLIGVTAHHSPGAHDVEACLVSDIDLAILGSHPDRFDEYEAQIRAEHSWVALDVFSRKRAAILKSFLDRPQIYQTPLLALMFEEQARWNLARGLA